MPQKIKNNIVHPPMLRQRSAPIIERAPLPIIEVQGKDHLVTYVNSAFCSLLEKSRQDLIGKPFCQIVPKGEECLPVLDKVYETGAAVTLAHEDEFEPAHWLFAMWPALDEEERPVGVIIQLTKAAKFQKDVTEVNEALLLAGLRQHEMTEQAEHLNAQLLNEIAERKQVEKTLRRSEERFRTLFELGPVAVYSCDVSGVIQEFNSRAAELWGRKPKKGDADERFCGSHKMIRPDNTVLPHEQCPMAEVLSGEIPEARDMEVQIERPDGSRVIVIVNIRPLKNEREEIIGAINCFVDITGRKQAEEKLRESEREIKRARDYAEATLRTAPVPLIILRADLRVNTTNEAFCNTFQVQPGEAEGKLIYDLGNGQWNIPELRKLLEDILPKNKVFNDYEVTHNFETIGRRTMLLNARRLENEAGQPLRIVLAIEDITQRKFAEEVLRQSEERYRNLFNSIDEGFCIIEMIFDKNEKPVDYRFLEVNPSFEKQSGLHDALGKRMLELAPNHEAHWFEIFGKVALTGEPVRFMNEAIALQRWFDVYGFRIGGSGSRKVAVLFTDITERKQNETELRESRERISRHADILETQVIDRTARLEASIKSLENLNYTMAHDLRAPIRSMKGLTTILLEDVPLNETGKDYAEKIIAAAGRMGQLVDDLLEYGELSHREFPMQALDLKTEIEEALMENAKEIHEAKAEVKVREPLPGVSGNKTLLQQILSNLLLNAVKFVPTGTQPKILIHAEARGHLVRLWLEDQGIGIEEKYQEKIFGVFQRLHSTEEYRGTGVGLAIVKRAVERMGGRVGVESVVGDGSRFWIEVPESKTRR